MAVMSSGRVGDQVALISVLYEFQQPVCITLDYYLQESRPGTSGTLSVYLLTKQHVPIRLSFGKMSQVWSDIGDIGDWKHRCVHIPSGTYHVMFLATLGLPYNSDIYLDNIQFRPEYLCSGNDIMPTGNFILLLTSRMNYFVTDA